MPFQSFQSGCGTCNASTDYPDIYYSQNPTLASNTVPQGPQSGAGKKKRVTKKKSTSTKKKSTSTKKKSTSTKKKSTSTKKKSTKVKKMRGGASESFKLDDQFIRDNLGISFETVGGNPTPLPPQYYKGGMLDSLRTGSMAGYDAMEGKHALVGAGKKKRVTKKKSVKKVTQKKGVKKTK
ncbi:MAG: hypothetical protein ACOVNP_00890, partial [Flavobacterium sp.]